MRINILPPRPLTGRLLKERRYICTDLIWGAAMYRRKRRKRSRTPIILRGGSCDPAAPEEDAPKVLTETAASSARHVKYDSTAEEQVRLGDVVQSLVPALRQRAYCSQKRRKVELSTGYTTHLQPLGSRVFGIIQPALPRPSGHQRFSRNFPRPLSPGAQVQIPVQFSLIMVRWLSPGEQILASGKCFKADYTRDGQLEFDSW